MSNQKNTNSKAKTNANRNKPKTADYANRKKQAKKQEQKKIIIIAAAVAAVIAVVLLGIFVIKPAIEKKDPDVQTGRYTDATVAAKPAVTHSFETVTPPEDSDYEYVDYRGLKMPAEVAAILNQAEIDNAEACKKYGVAMRLGEHQISRPRFEMYYNYVCAEKTTESLAMAANNQMNTTGFNYNLAPSAQKYPGSQDMNYTWADKFTDDAIVDMQFYFAAFEYAVEAKIQLSDGVFQRMIYEYERAIETAENKGLSLDAYLNSTVAENITYEMYAAHCIMKYYAAEYQESELEKYSNAVTQAELDKYYKDNKNTLQVANVRIYPIEKEYTEADLKTVVDEKSYLAFAQKHTPYTVYDAETETEYYWVDYNTVGGTFGEDVAKWIFEGNVKAGDVGFAKGALYECLVYVIKAPFEIATHQAVVCEFPNTAVSDETMIEENKRSADAAQEAFIEYGSNRAAALKLVDEMFGFNMPVSVRDYGIDVDKWVFDPARKEGDSVRIDNADGSYFIVYLNANPTDYDWIDVARGSMGGEKYDVDFEARVNKDFVAQNKNGGCIVAAQEHSYSILSPYIEDRKSMLGIS